MLHCNIKNRPVATTFRQRAGQVAMILDVNLIWGIVSCSYSMDALK